MKNKLVLVIMDGIGISKEEYGNAILNAKTPNLDYLFQNYPHTLIHASGEYVGLLPNDMGNSEVGHNALGSGQIYAQGSKLVNEKIQSGELFEGKTWKQLVEYCKKEGRMHLIGLLSDGNVHSNINHLLALLEYAKKDGVRKVLVHILLDGRDVSPTSALEYIDILEKKMRELNDEKFHSMIASGGGRMKITMDRYEANWQMVEKGWHTHVLGDAKHYKSAKAAIIDNRIQNPSVIDQDLEPFVIVNEHDEPVGEIKDHDSVIFFNFRGDRALELSRAFDEEKFDKFDRRRKPKVMYAGMVQYDSDLQIPKNYLTEPPMITNTLTEQLSKYNICEYAISETQKYGHVTYFWNGNKLEKISDELETYDLIPSDIIPFNEKPEMKAYEITDKLIEAIQSDKYDFLRVNYPNGDMVGHTGDYEATIKAVEAVDENLGRIMDIIKKTNSILIILADHGNAEEMYELKDKTKKIPKTSHTKNLVPFIIYGQNIANLSIKDGEFGLANVASTIVTILDIPSDLKWEESIITKKQ